MLRDARTLTDGAELTADVCIVGSGPGGLTVAAHLAGSGRSVIVLETGGEEPDPQIQRLAEGDVVGDPLLNPSTIRHRRIGGNANAWCLKMADGGIGVRHAALEAHDFERREWIPESGWPFDLDHLRPFYERASVTCGCSARPYDADPWERGEAMRWTLDPSIVTSRVFQFGASTSFTQVLRGRIEQDPNSTLLHHATAVEIEVNESGRAAERVRCRQFDGREFTVAATTIVLATGGLANASLLLQSNSRLPNGVGNGNDLVGRYLQDHPLVAGGSMVLARKELWNRSAFYDMRLVDGTSALGHLSVAAEAQRKDHLLGLSAVFFPRPTQRRSVGLDAMKQFVETRSEGHSPAQLMSYGARMLAGADYLPIAAYRKLRWHQSLYPGFGRGGWSEMPTLDRKFVRFEVIHQAEQSPEPTNRVMLGREKDALGCPRLRVEWKFSRSDSEAAARGRRVIAAELLRAGIGTVTLPDDGDLPELGTAAGTAHHIGTTRMHDDPKRGVTDRNARLHEVENVYVAGSSLFPTGAFANPTLTIVALAHRLADHLASR